MTPGQYIGRERRNSDGTVDEKGQAGLQMPD